MIFFFISVLMYRVLLSSAYVDYWSTQAEISLPVCKLGLLKSRVQYAKRSLYVDLFVNKTHKTLIFYNLIRPRLVQNWPWASKIRNPRVRIMPIFLYYSDLG